MRGIDILHIHTKGTITHTQSRTRNHAHAITHTQSRNHAHTITHTHAFTNSRILKFTHTHIQAFTH